MTQTTRRQVSGTRDSLDAAQAILNVYTNPPSGYAFTGQG